MSEKLEVKQLREMIQEAIKEVSGKKKTSQPKIKKEECEPVKEQSDAEITDKHKKKGISSMKDFKGPTRKGPPPVPANAKRKKMNEAVKKLITKMVVEAIEEQISGMGMGMGGRQTSGLPGQGSVRKAQQSGQQSFDWAEDLKKVKDPNASLDDLLKLANHQNDQVKNLAKQGLRKKLFDVGVEVK